MFIKYYVGIHTYTHFQLKKYSDNQNVFSFTMNNISLGKNQTVDFGRKHVR